MVLLFTLSMAELNITFNLFYGNIIQLFQVYKWYEAIFPLTIEVYIYIILF